VDLDLEAAGLRRRRGVDDLVDREHSEHLVATCGGLRLAADAGRGIGERDVAWCHVRVAAGASSFYTFFND
jgi:hypothetical protein